MPDADSEALKTHVPPNASERAAEFWKEGWISRARRFITPGNDELIRSMFVVLAESFSLQEFDYAVRTGYDLIPELQRRYLDNRFSRRIARAIIRIQWSAVFRYLMHPATCRELIRQVDPAKGAIFDTPQGQAYLNWLAFHLLLLLRDKGEIKDCPIIRAPPGVCAIHHSLCMRASVPAPPSAPGPNP